MPWFIKQETFTTAMTTLPAEQRRQHCEDHRAWVESQRSSGLRIASGFLVDEDHKPGGGGAIEVDDLLPGDWELLVYVPRADAPRRVPFTLASGEVRDLGLLAP